MGAARRSHRYTDERLRLRVRPEPGEGTWGALVLVTVTPVLIIASLVVGSWTIGSARRGRFLREAGLLICAYFAYFISRGITEGSFDEAREHAQLLVEFERSLGIFVDPSAQALVMSEQALRTVANLVYVWGHWPVVGGVAIWLYARRPDAYHVYRNALLISGAIGLVVYVAFPAAPPRLMGLGFVDTVFDHSVVASILQPTALTNQYAAFPSLHFGWSLLVGIAVVRQARSTGWTLAAPLLPLAMLISVVVTANHYVVDAVAGGIVALTGLTVASLWYRFAHSLAEWLGWGDAIPGMTVRESVLVNGAAPPAQLRRARRELETRIAEFTLRPELPLS